MVKKHPHPKFCLCQVVITVFLEADEPSPVPATEAEDENVEQPTLIFNVYCPKLSKSADVDLPHAMQNMMTGETCSFTRFPQRFASTQATDVSIMVSFRSAVTDRVT